MVLLDLRDRKTVLLPQTQPPAQQYLEMIEDFEVAQALSKPLND